MREIWHVIVGCCGVIGGTDRNKTFESGLVLVLQFVRQVRYH